MTRIKMCGLTREFDIDAVNELRPDYVGFVFAPQSRRCITADRARLLKKRLVPLITAVGVFTDEQPEIIASLVNGKVIDVVQLHGDEDERYISRLRELAGCPVIKAFKIKGAADLKAAAESSADCVLLDSGAGTGKVFSWDLISDLRRPYFLAGGLEPGNAGDAIARLRPFAVDVSSGIETDGVKDKEKMAAFISAVREADRS